MAVLELSGVSKHFGAIQALTDVSLSLQAGEVVGLMGDNGAGKSTLVKIIAGNFPATHGEIRFEGNTVHFHRPIDARAVGIEVVYQDLALADLADRVLADGLDPQPRSGRQEYLESVINRYV